MRKPDIKFPEIKKRYFYIPEKVSKHMKQQNNNVLKCTFSVYDFFFQGIWAFFMDRRAYCYYLTYVINDFVV